MTDKPTIALLYALINAFFLTAMGLFAKLLGEFFGPIEVTFFRNLVSLALLIIGLLFFRHLWVIKTDRPFAQFFRALIGTIGIVLGVWTYSLVPLTEATILYFTSPLFVVLLSVLVLKERIGPVRLGAVFIGFCGVLIMTGGWNGDSEISTFGLIIGLSYAFVAAAVDVCLRWLGRTEHALTTTFFFLFFGFILTALYWPFSDASITVAFDPNVLWIMLGLGFVGICSQISKTQSFRLGEATLVAPIIYTMIIWAALFDYLIWDRVPSWNAILGAMIIIASNLFILWREKNRKRTRRDAMRDQSQTADRIEQ